MAREIFALAAGQDLLCSTRGRLVSAGLSLFRFKVGGLWAAAAAWGRLKETCCASGQRFRNPLYDYVAFILRDDTRSIIEPSRTPREERLRQLVSTARLSDSLQHDQRHGLWYMSITAMEDVADDQQRI